MNDGALAILDHVPQEGTLFFQNHLLCLEPKEYLTYNSKKKTPKLVNILSMGRNFDPFAYEWVNLGNFYNLRS